jgi:SAM-dependent MidA family methyltransferase
MTHPAFGALIAAQLAQVWRALGSPFPFWVIEPAAGNGRLAADIRASLAGRDPVFVGALRYVTLDVAAPSAGVRSAGLPLHVPNGVVLANELLDAMPVHRLTVVDGELRELRVGLDDEGDAGAFIDVASEPTPGLTERLRAVGAELSEGQVAEVNLGLDTWMAEAAAAIDTGYVMLIDYGHEAPDYYDASRSRGTLRCYYRHTMNMSPYQHVGRQDISVHVELTSLRRAAAGAGLTEVGNTSQAAFLRGLGFDSLRAVAPSGDRAALDTLVDPEGMGGFRVLAFGKGAKVTELSGFGGPAIMWEGEAPRSTLGHLPPGGEQEPDMPTWEELLR